MTALGPLPEPEVLVRKVRARSHGGHHGGAWKVAYADFVTAMMAFFLLMWLLGATNEDQRRGIADYFAPTVLQSDKSGGSNGVLAGRSLEEPDGIAPHARRAGVNPAAPFQAPHGARSPARADDGQMRRVESEIRQRLARDPGLRELQGQVRFVHTPEGLRIEIVDRANYSMFAAGTAVLDSRADALLRVVADVIAPLPQRIAIRGHTDALPFGRRAGGNNWTLSSARAEATRQALAAGGIDGRRFSRLEGVADTEPLFPEDPTDPRNRRLSVTLLRG